MTLKDILKSCHLYYEGPERRQRDDNHYQGFERRNFRPTCLTIAVTSIALATIVSYILLTQEPHYPNKHRKPTIESVAPTPYSTNYQSQE